jgi:hypothetical protein
MKCFCLFFSYRPDVSHRATAPESRDVHSGGFYIQLDRHVPDPRRVAVVAHLISTGNHGMGSREYTFCWLSALEDTARLAIENGAALRVDALINDREAPFNRDMVN